MNVWNGNALAVARAVAPDSLCPSISVRAFPGDTKTMIVLFYRGFFLFYQFALMLVLLSHNSFKKRKQEKTLLFKETCKSSTLYNNHRLGVEALSLHSLILCVTNVLLIVLTVTCFMNICTHGCMEWHRTSLALALSVSIHTVIFVLYFPVILNFMLLQLNLKAVQFSLKTGELTFQPLCYLFS